MCHRLVIGIAVAIGLAVPSLADDWPTKDWPTSTPDAVGLDAQVLANFDADLASGK